jgi:hypothetical protein
MFSQKHLSCAIFGTSTGKLSSASLLLLLLLLLVGVYISSTSNTDSRENCTLEIQVELEDGVLKVSMAHTSKARCAHLNVQVEILPHK